MLTLTRISLNRPKCLFWCGLLSDSLFVSELPPAPQLEADKLPEQPRLGQTHQQQNSHPGAERRILVPFWLGFVISAVNQAHKPKSCS